MRYNKLVYKRKNDYVSIILGVWPSGKAPLFGSGIRRFESYHPSQLIDD